MAEPAARSPVKRVRAAAAAAAAALSPVRSSKRVRTEKYDADLAAAVAASLDDSPAAAAAARSVSPAPAADVVFSRALRPGGGGGHNHRAKRTLSSSLPVVKSAKPDSSGAVESPPPSSSSSSSAAAAAAGAASDQTSMSANDRRFRKVPLTASELDEYHALIRSIWVNGDAYAPASLLTHATNPFQTAALLMGSVIPSAPDSLHSGATLQAPSPSDSQTGRLLSHVLRAFGIVDSGAAAAAASTIGRYRNIPKLTPAQSEDLVAMRGADAWPKPWNCLERYEQLSDDESDPFEFDELNGSERGGSTTAAAAALLNDSIAVKPESERILLSRTTVASPELWPAPSPAASPAAPPATSPDASPLAPPASRSVSGGDHTDHKHSFGSSASRVVSTSASSAAAVTTAPSASAASSVPSHSASREASVSVERMTPYRGVSTPRTPSEELCTQPDYDFHYAALSAVANRVWSRVVSRLPPAPPTIAPTSPTDIESKQPVAADSGLVDSDGGDDDTASASAAASDSASHTAQSASAGRTDAPSAPARSILHGTRLDDTSRSMAVALTAQFMKDLLHALLVRTPAPAVRERVPDRMFRLNQTNRKLTSAEASDPVPDQSASPRTSSAAATAVTPPRESPTAASSAVAISTRRIGVPDRAVGQRPTPVHIRASGGKPRAVGATIRQFRASAVTVLDTAAESEFVDVPQRVHNVSRKRLQSVVSFAAVAADE